MSVTRPRYTEDEFPPYSYVPGHTPHPVSDPAGHMFGETPHEAAPLETQDWKKSQPYLHGIDLFNHGYYWEAHEAWEALWHAAGRKGQVADFLKGLIKLAAAGVKAREGNPRGVERHACRAEELLATVKSAQFCGLQISRLDKAANELVDTAAHYDKAQPTLLLNLVLQFDTNN